MHNYRFTYRELKQYKAEKASAESKRLDTTNACLVAFRRSNRELDSRHPQMHKVFSNLNQKVRKEPFEETMKVVNFWLEKDDFRE